MISIEFSHSTNLQNISLPHLKFYIFPRSKIVILNFSFWIQISNVIMSHVFRYNSSVRRSENKNVRLPGAPLGHATYGCASRKNCTITQPRTAARLVPRTFFRNNPNILDCKGSPNHLINLESPNYYYFRFLTVGNRNFYFYD